jgi:hypothetical protein
MIGVMLDQSAAPMLPFTVRGRVRPIRGNERRSRGLRGSPHC